MHFKLGSASIGAFHPGIRAWGVTEGIKVQFHNLVAAKAQVRITDALGRVLYNEKEVSTCEDFLYPITGEKLGLYTIIVITADQLLTEKIIR